MYSLDDLYDLIRKTLLRYAGFDPEEPVFPPHSNTCKWFYGNLEDCTCGVYDLDQYYLKRGKQL